MLTITLGITDCTKLWVGITGLKNPIGDPQQLYTNMVPTSQTSQVLFRLLIVSLYHFQIYQNVVLGYNHG